MRILAVDDDDEFLELLQFHFERAGIDVVTCTSGKRALELLEVHRFEVIMVDLVMPVMGGRSLARNIRQAPAPRRPTDRHDDPHEQRPTDRRRACGGCKPFHQQGRGARGPSFNS